MIPLPVSKLEINFNRLFIKPDGVLVEWAPSKNSDCANASFVLQGYTLSNIQDGSLDAPNIVIAGGQQNSARILRDQLRLAHNVTLFYRLVALFENGRICQHEQTDNIFYDFACKCSLVHTHECSMEGVGGGCSVPVYMRPKQERWF